MIPRIYGLAHIPTTYTYHMFLMNVVIIICFAAIISDFEFRYRNTRTS